MLTLIPFSGFYNSIHESEIDRTVENMISDSSGCDPVSDTIANEIWMYTGDVSTEYAKEYLAVFTQWFSEEVGFKCKFEFDELSSPKEYNFTTDRIFAKVSRDTVRKLYRLVDKTALDEVIKDKFTSRSGFISYYTPDRGVWGSVDTWDHNQVLCILETLVNSFDEENWEYNLVEDFSGNGYLDNWVYDALNDEGKRLVKIAGYLREREERRYSVSA